MRIRRGLDAVVVLLASPVLLVLGSLAMFAVFLEDRHAPIIRLLRVGRDGQAMRVAKIRSMRVGGGAAITSSDDDRVTRTGHQLRRLRLDEIPQVLQVLRGEMALIGPRPESPGFVDLEDPRWQRILSARPAIAGMTQVIAGTWEATELNVEDPEQLYRDVAVPAKLALDDWYVANASPLVDLKIVMSVFQMLLRGAETTPAHQIAADHIPEALALLQPRSGPVV